MMQLDGYTATGDALAAKLHTLAGAQLPALFGRPLMRGLERLEVRVRHLAALRALAARLDATGDRALWSLAEQIAALLKSFEVGYPRVTSGYRPATEIEQLLMPLMSGPRTARQLSDLLKAD